MAKDFLIAIDTNVLLILSKNRDKRRKYIVHILRYVYNTPENANIMLVIPYLVLLEYTETLIRWSKSEYLIRKKKYRFGEMVGPEGKEIRIKEELPDEILKSTLKPIDELCENPKVKLLKNPPDWEFAYSLVKMGLEARDAVILSQIVKSSDIGESGCDIFVTTDREILALAGNTKLLKETKIKRVSTPKGAIAVLKKRFGPLDTWGVDLHSP